MILNSLIIPCYNEEKNLYKSYSKLLKIPSKIKGELILVNNGSLDGTKKILKNLSEKNPRIKIINIKKNIGYGHGILTGLKASRGKFVGWTHADGQTDHFEAIKGFAFIENEKDPNKVLIMGKRSSRKFSEKIFELLMSLFETILFKTNMNDITAQPKIMSKDFFISWKNPPVDFSLDLYAYAVAKKRNLSIKKYKINYQKRNYGISSWNDGLFSKIKLSMKTISYSIKLFKSLKNEK